MTTEVLPGTWDSYFPDLTRPSHAGLRLALGRKAAPPVISPDVRPETVAIEAVIAFANSDATPAPDGYRDAAEDEWDGNPPCPPSSAPANIKAQRQRARDMLSDAANGLPALAKRLASYASDGQASDVRLFPFLKFEGAARAEPRLLWVLGGPATADGWTRFAALAIAEQANRERRQTNVGRCKASDCGRFFLVTANGKGKPRRDYCCTEHRLKTHAAGATRRSQVMRERDKASVRAATARRHK